MKITDLYETPLPSSWDSEIYDERVPFKTRVEYAKERAQRIGRGSSRVVFKIKYKGRDTALKIAMNRKGMAQNFEEAQLLEDWYLRDLKLFIPLIDYDEKGANPTWIHTSYAKPITEAQFKRYVGLTPLALVGYVKQFHGDHFGIPLGDTSHVNPENPIVEAMIDYYGNFNRPNINDYTNIKNWGLYNRRPIIVDAGLTDQIFDTFYRR